MTPAKLRKLQRMIDKTATLVTQFYRAQELLNVWCIDEYGFEPGDRDVDEIIDAVLGGAGESPGMTAEDFNNAMERVK